MTRRGILIPALAALLAAAAPADTTINVVNRHAYGANVGWLDGRGDVTHGAVLGQHYVTGSVWSANCGWIGLGNGPTNGWSYSNASGADWGVNHDGLGALRGYAYGANIGWLVFGPDGDPRVDLFTGQLSGFAWGANVGWVSLDSAYALVQTDRLAPGPDTDGDGLPDAWELAQTGSLTNLQGGGADADLDGAPDAGEYLADTHPLHAGSRLAITDVQRAADTNRVTWTVRPTRLYQLEQAGTVTNGSPWADSGLGKLAPGPAGTLTHGVPATNAAGFYRARALMPLAP